MQSKTRSDTIVGWFMSKPFSAMSVHCTWRHYVQLTQKHTQNVKCQECRHERNEKHFSSSVHFYSTFFFLDKMRWCKWKTNQIKPIKKNTKWKTSSVKVLGIGNFYFFPIESAPRICVPEILTYISNQKTLIASKIDTHTFLLDENLNSKNSLFKRKKGKPFFFFNRNHLYWRWNIQEKKQNKILL